MTCSVKAYAKINLHLDVTGIRDDGYHSVETVMQTVSLFDTVTVSLNDSGEISCQCDVAGVPTDEKNIAVKAAKLFLEATGRGDGVFINIEKRIPMAAGMAGGSTDAAATLEALNYLCKNPFSLSELCELGAKLGADVPFCIAGGCAYSDGRGDVLYSFPAIPENTVFLVACGGEGVSTPWAYKTLDDAYDLFVDYEARGTEKMRAALLSERPESFAEHIFNSFESPIFAQRPVAKHIKESMLKGGAKASMMSGSGPSVFGIFTDFDSAKAVENEIKKEGYFAAMCYPVDKK